MMAEIKPADEASTGEHFIGIDVGTGSARACIIDSTGDIKALASHDIKLWQEGSHYEQSTTDIWSAICHCVKQCLTTSSIPPTSINGIGFDATCSLAVFSHTDDTPMPVTQSTSFTPDADGNNRNIILWLDHRAIDETARINATKHNLLKYVGGSMSVEMEIPKVLWLKEHMPREIFEKCKFYDLADALTHMCTGKETRSFCSTVCKQGYVPVGVDGSVKGWQGDFLREIGLGDLVEDEFKRMGGVNGVNGEYLSAGELVGTLSRSAAKDLGLPPGIHIGSGVIDAYAGWIGTVGAKVDLPSSAISNTSSSDTDSATSISQVFTRLAAVAGTSTCHLAMSRTPIFVPGVWGPYRDVLIPEFWMAEGGQSATGELLRYMLSTHPAHAEVSKKAREEGKNIYDYLNGQLTHLQRSQSAPYVGHLTRHIFFYGDLFGNRSPIASPHMRGSLIGLSSESETPTGLALLYYVVMEFIALQTRHIVDTMNTSGHDIRSIFMSGSQCQNSILMDLIATACKVPVVVPQYVNAAVVHGAAMLGAKAASGRGKEGRETEALWSVMGRMSKPGKAVLPSEDRRVVRLLEVKYKVFLDQARTQQEYRGWVDEVVKDA